MTTSDDKSGLSDDKAFAANVKRIREEHSWSLNDLATRLRDEGLSNFHPNTVLRVEAGQRSVRVGEISAFERALGTKFVDLLLPTVDLAMLDRLEAAVVRATDSASDLAESVGEFAEAQRGLYRIMYELERAKVVDDLSGEQRDRVYALIRNGQVLLQTAAEEIVRNAEDLAFDPEHGDPGDLTTDFDSFVAPPD